MWYCIVGRRVRSVVVNDRGGLYVTGLQQANSSHQAQDVEVTHSAVIETISIRL